MSHRDGQRHGPGGMFHPCKANGIWVLIASVILISACAAPKGAGTGASYQAIDVATARMLQEQGAVFVDLRGRSWYDSGHVPGAVNLPFPNFNETSLSRIADRETPVVFYCFGIHCDYSNIASGKAYVWGYREVYYFIKGYPGWLDAGYPVEKTSS